MGILIKGIKMPENCDECRFRSEAWCLALNDWRKAYNTPPNGERLEDCPLVELPAEHGRLGDLDALITTFCEWGTRLERGRKLVITMSEAKQAIVDIIEDAPTIIPEPPKE